MTPVGCLTRQDRSQGGVGHPPEAADHRSHRCRTPSRPLKPPPNLGHQTGAVDSEQRRVVGYHALAAARPERQAATARVIKGIPQYPIPIILLARRAVDRSVAGRGLGAWLLRYAMLRTPRRRRRSVSRRCSSTPSTSMPAPSISPPRLRALSKRPAAPHDLDQGHRSGAERGVAPDVSCAIAFLRVGGPSAALRTLVADEKPSQRYSQDPFATQAWPETGHAAPSRPQAATARRCCFALGAAASLSGARCCLGGRWRVSS